MAAFNPQPQQQQQHHQQQSYNNNSSTSISSSSSNSSTSDNPLSTRTSPRSHINNNNETSMLPETIGKRVHPQHSQVLHSRVKEILKIHYDSFPGSQPISFERKHLTKLEQEDYFVCEKTDGVRYLLFFLHSSKGPASFLFDRNRNWYYIPNLLFPMRGREKECLKDTLMDGELVMDTEPNNSDKKIWRFLIFDLMSLNGVPVTKRSFNTRLGMLQQEVIGPFKNSIRHMSDSVKSPPFSIELKKMERSYGLHLILDQMTKLKHSSDGVIWTPVKHPYIPGTCDKLLKWKPPELNTVDFRISAKWSKEHKPIYNLEVLSHGVTYKFYDHFQPESELATEWKNHLPDGRIAEFRYDREWAVTIVEQGYAPTTRKGGWRFVRFRGDKDTANDENVVRKIVHSIEQGITKEELLQHMDKVRSAWKAREKGLSIPASSSKPTPEHLTLSTTTTTSRPAIASLNTSLITPTSATTPAILPSPSVTNMGSSYFPSNYDYVIKSRNNSIDMGRVNDTNSRRQSEPDMSSLSTTTTKGVFLKHEPTLQQVDENEEENENHDDNSKEEEEVVNKRKRADKEKVIVPLSGSSVIPEDLKSTTKNERKLSTDSNNSNAAASLSEDGQSSNKRDSPRMSTSLMERKRFKSWTGDWTSAEEKRSSAVATTVYDDCSHQSTASTVPQSISSSSLSLSPLRSSAATVPTTSVDEHEGESNGQPPSIQQEKREDQKSKQHQLSPKKKEPWIPENYNNKQEESRRRKISASSRDGDVDDPTKRQPSYIESSTSDFAHSEKGTKLRKVACEYSGTSSNVQINEEEAMQRVVNNDNVSAKNGKPWSSISSAISSPLSIYEQQRHNLEHSNAKPASASPIVMRKSNSSSIHSLLTTSVEPTLVFKADNRSSTPPTVEEQQRQRLLAKRSPREQQQQQHNRAYDFATILQSSDNSYSKQQYPQQSLSQPSSRRTSSHSPRPPPPPPPQPQPQHHPHPQQEHHSSAHSRPPSKSHSQQHHSSIDQQRVVHHSPAVSHQPTLVHRSPTVSQQQAQVHRSPTLQQQQNQVHRSPSTQQQPVHFINYHADGSHIRLAPTEAREWHHHPQAQQQQQQQKLSPQQQAAHPTQQPQGYVRASSTPEQTGGRQLHVWKASDSAPKLSSQQQQQQQQQQQRDKHYQQHYSQQQHQHVYGSTPPVTNATIPPQPQPPAPPPSNQQQMYSPDYHNPHHQQSTMAPQQQVASKNTPPTIPPGPQPHMSYSQTSEKQQRYSKKQSGASNEYDERQHYSYHPQQHPHPQQQYQHYPSHSQQQSPPPLPPPPASQRSQHERSKSSKAKLDFILN